MGRACSVHRGNERCTQGFGVGNLREGDHLEYSGVRWEVNIKMYLQELGWRGEYCLD
jgi:hypothetical protein